MSSNESYKKLVVKIGSSTLTTSEHSIDRGYIERLGAQIAQLKSEGWEVVVVSSAAIACGLERLGMDVRPTDIPTLQAAASVGQCALASVYEEALAAHDVVTSLVLLTRHDTAERSAYLHARDTFEKLLDLGVVPIVNENDTVSVEQIRFGDNDTLAALVACLIGADLMVVLSDIDGLYDSDPRKNPDAELVHRIKKIDQSVLDAAGGAGTAAGSGGMVTKLAAARVLMIAGIPMVIAHGGEEDVVLRAAHGDQIGTYFEGGTASEIAPRKLWIALGDKSRGSIYVDDGAKNALIKRGSSLLSVGVQKLDGKFESGDIVDIKDDSGFVFARGRAGASSDEIDLARGLTSAELEANRLLKPLASKPVIHRDELIVFE